MQDIQIKMIKQLFLQVKFTTHESISPNKYPLVSQYFYNQFTKLLLLLLLMESVRMKMLLENFHENDLFIL